MTSPNIIVFLADDLGFGDVGSHGNGVVQTPHLDAFARESVELDRFYVCPVCSPTRASLMTGRWNFRTGVTDVFGEGCVMNADEITVAQDLRDAGYATGLFGKWHLGDDGPQRPTQKGFDEVLTFRGCAMGVDQYFDPVLVHNDTEEQYTGYCMDVFTDAAIEFMNTHRDGPFFIFLPANLIHAPLVAPDPLLEAYDNLGLRDSTQVIYAMTQSLDENFGRLRSALQDLGIEDNTLLIATSDNGPCTGSDPLDRHMAGLHGLKGTVYENGIRVPCWMRWPEGFEGGAVHRSNTSHVDLLPTLLDAAGVTPQEDRVLDGRSLLPVLHNPEAAGPDRNFFFQWDSGQEPRKGKAYCVLNDRWKLVQPCGMDSPGQQHIRDCYTALCELQGRGSRRIDGPPRFELYDLKADPGEEHDVAANHPEIVDQLRSAYEQWFEDVCKKK